MMARKPKRPAPRIYECIATHFIADRFYRAGARVEASDDDPSVGVSPYWIPDGQPDRVREAALTALQGSDPGDPRRGGANPSAGREKKRPAQVIVGHGASVGVVLSGQDITDQGPREFVIRDPALALLPPGGEDEW